ncbi:MAG: ATPase [Nitrososphaerota archaeon]|nr:ATPase [Nitrososphaerota archaeon]
MRKVLSGLFMATALMFLVAALSAPAAAQTTTSTVSSSSGDKFLGAAIAFGLAALGAGLGVGTSGSAAIAAVTEKAEVRTSALIFVVLAEAIAIYGFVIAFVILGSSG